MKLSACLIVKDEAANLPRCLASLKGLADEIVVVDTGSTDETVAIAREAGAKIGHFAWCDDFAAARNAAIDLATGDWVLIVDADEEATLDDAAGLKAMLAGPPAAYLVPLEDVLHGGRDDRLGRVVRLFPRHAGLRFDGRIHESIGAGLKELGWPLLETAALHLTHHGYRPEVMAARDKPRRNLRLARLAAQERPDRPLSWFDLGRSAISANRLPEALAAWERLRGMPASDPYQPQYLATLEHLCKQLAADYVRHCQHLAGARLSACLIVKDEAANLPRCLASLRGHVDEIVVVDTGSTDDTVRIAREAGAKIGHFAWCDDFSAARNAAIELATGDWVLSIDADEELAVEDAIALRAAAVGEAKAYNLEIRNLDAAGRVESRYPSAPRLFRRDPAVRFAGRLHEDVSLALQARGWTSQPLPGVAIVHHGYVPAVVEARDKVGRNRRLAEAMTREQPDDPNAWIHLAAICWRARDVEPTLAAATRAFQLVEGGKPVAPHRLVGLAKCQAGALQAAGQPAAAQAALDRGLALRPGNPELAYERGRLRLDLGDVAGARTDFEACVAAHGHHLEGVVRAGITGFLPRTELAGLAVAAGQMELAATHVRAALADAACPPEEVERLQALLASVSRLAAPPPPPARRALLARLEADPRDAEAFLELAFDCFQQGQHDRALLAVGRTLELNATPTAFHLLGLVLAELGQPAWAERCFSTVLHLDANHPTALASRLEMRARRAAEELPAELVATLERYLALAAPTSSACLIVKDEAANLPRCLASLRGLVDEIVVVDTGSSDDTVAIAEAAGAKVGHFPWCDDFSAARNAAIELATGDWILSIDADEELVVPAAEDLKAALRYRVPGAYALKLSNVDGQGREALEASVVRLFQRLDGLGFEGRYQETIDAGLARLGLTVMACPAASLIHHGYAAEVVQARGKARRNLTLAELAIQDDPARAGAWYDLALARQEAGDLAGASEAFERLEGLDGGLLAMPRARRAHGVVHKAALLGQLGRQAEVDALLNRALAVEPGFPEFLFLRAQARSAQGDLAGAAADLEACLVDPARWAGLPMRPGITDELPRKVLAAMRAATPAPAEHQRHPDPATLMEQAFRAFQAGELDHALLAVAQLLERSASATGFQLAGLILADLGLASWAERCFATVLRLDPAHPTALTSRLEMRTRPPGEAPPELEAHLQRLLELAQPKLTACMIVKDEAANLPRALASLRGWADEIVVVDTGSSDETVAIAEAAGAKVGHFPWCDDFAAARNAALELASHEWILVLDADEELVVDDPAALAEAMRQRLNGGYIVRLSNVDAQGQAESHAPLLRLFRNLPELRYRGRLHESIAEGARGLGLPFPELDAVRLLHHGYRLAAVAERSKGERNLRLARLEAAAAPDSVATQLNLARSLALAGQADEALACLAGLTAPSELDDVSYMLYVMTYQDLLRQARRFQEADAVLTTGLARLPGTPDFLFERGNVRYRLGRPEEARADFQACLGARPSLQPLRPGVTDEMPRLALAQLARPRLGACMIVKDEAANLPRCLASLKGLVDEIVVVDTGSSDETVAIAEAAGASVGRFAWTGNFGEARNASLELASCDWVLVIDADEELVVQDETAFRAALAVAEVGAYIFPIHNLRDDGTFQVQPMMRLFRRHEQVRFAGRLHEEVTRAIEALGWQVRPLTGVYLRHHGYLQAAIAGRDKWARNLQIAIAEVEARPDEPLAWYNLGRSSLFTGQWEPAGAAFGQVARLLAEGKLMGEAPFCNYVLLRKRLLSQAGQADAAEAMLDEGLARVPGFPEFHYERALLRRARGDLGGAIADLEACMQPTERFYTGAIRPEVRGPLPAKLLADLRGSS